MKAMKVKSYIYHLSLRTDQLITRSRTHLNECQTTSVESVFSKSTAPRLPSRHVEHHQTMMTARLGLETTTTPNRHTDYVGW